MGLIQLNIDNIDTFLVWNFKHLMSINCVFLHILRYSSKSRSGPYVSWYFIFMHGLIVESLKKV